MSLFHHDVSQHHNNKPGGSGEPYAAFIDHPAVKHLGVRSYCGLPLVSQGEVIGGVCAFDMQTRTFSDEQVQRLRELSEEVSELLSVKDLEADALELIRRPPPGELAESERLEVFSLPRSRRWWSRRRTA